ncbi:hypothetical protein B4119_2351 [Parageobacillus caldoxylosilyticus]|uniref:Uncharacterized protein n=3 Tax=Saccharococcus caldoxylosilyticus TaxID=81408 RepID=A0A023DH09_9BACL|nr:hypothetical protein B4119_2351 [Parageobacillus caldoxylosilyticus]MBB3853216.1 hypothetical protein [Parageobacillus caldoxylosilyticus]GAJ40589.1 hypothetical protein GCA01S_047_00120 [Parageobacillus caldoxylosilyticus NBRC 107762]
MGLLMTWIEKQAETIGWFVHSFEWKHIYSFVGYSLFIAMVWRFYRWMWFALEAMDIKKDCRIFNGNPLLRKKRDILNYTVNLPLLK